MSQRILEYTDVAGKIVEKVTFTNEEDWHMITIRFTDQTQLAFSAKNAPGSEVRTNGLANGGRKNAETISDSSRAALRPVLEARSLAS